MGASLLALAKSIYYKLDINFLFHLIVSPYGRLFNEQALFIDLQNIFTAFAVGLSGQKLNSEYYARKFFIIAVVFWVLVLGKDTKNMAEHVIMKKIVMQCICRGQGQGQSQVFWVQRTKILYPAAYSGIYIFNVFLGFSG